MAMATSETMNSCCPACDCQTGKLRTEWVGNGRGVWCTQCGHSTTSVEDWNSALRGGVDEAPARTPARRPLGDGDLVQMRAQPETTGVIRRGQSGAWYVDGQGLAMTRSWTYCSRHSLELNWEARR